MASSLLNIFTMALLATSAVAGPRGCGGKGQRSCRPLPMPAFPQEAPKAARSDLDLGNLLEARSNVPVLAHDAIVGFNTTVPDNTWGRLYTKYKPQLSVPDGTGCHPYPAVDAAGHMGGGLEASGPVDGECTNSTGQVYARGGSHDGHFAVMYAWYFPKTEPSAGIGHRHDWLSCVVYLSDLREDARVLGVAVQKHEEKYKTNPAPIFNGTAPMIKTVVNWPRNRKLDFTDKAENVQFDMPLIAWESMPDVTHLALNTGDFGEATVPFKDEVFAEMLGHAKVGF